VRPGGLNRYLAELHRALCALGVESKVFVAAEGATDPGYEAVVAHNAPAWRRPLRFWCSMRSQQPQPDVYDAHFAFHAVLLVLFGKTRKVPLVVHFQGPWGAESAVQGANPLVVYIKRAIERVVYRRAETVVVLSEAFRDLLISDYGVSTSRIQVVAPGVDVGRFVPGSRQDARHALGIAEGRPVAVAVRRLVPRMGLDVLLRAWTRLPSGPDGPLLAIVGAGPDRDRLERLAQNLGISSNVRFVGRVTEEQLPSWYLAADVSVVPSVALEGFGLVALESLACGTPVVASDVGGLREALGALRSDLLVSPGDPEALGDRLRRALLDGAVPSAAACREFAETHSWAQVAKRHREIYERVRGHRPMRIAVVGHTAQPSGGELALARLIPALKDVEIHVILAEDGPIVEQLVEAGATVEVLPLAEGTRALSRGDVRAGRLPFRAVLDAARYVLRLQRVLQAWSPDVVHTNTLKAALYGGLAARLARIPCVWHIRDSITTDYLPPPAVRLVRVAARLLPNEIVANSNSTLSSLRLPVGRGTVLASPVLPVAATKTSDAFRPLRVGMLGRLSPWKGQDVFLRAFATAFKDQPDVEAVIVGDALFGEQAFVLQTHQLAQDLGIAHRTDFRGFRNDVGIELNRLDILVHASISPEPFGQVIVQGMAAGLPVVASAAGGPTEIVTNGVDGLLYPPGDVAELAGLLTRLAGDSALRHQLGQAGHERSQEYAPDRIAPALLTTYRRAISSSQSAHSLSSALD
jgi:glycosyltransferase involved in cell wall biosynthesis